MVDPWQREEQQSRLERLDKRLGTEALGENREHSSLDPSAEPTPIAQQSSCSGRTLTSEQQQPEGKQ